MRLPCVRFTLRSVMVGVAVVAGVIWGSQTTAASLRLAQYHASQEMSLRTAWAERSGVQAVSTANTNPTGVVCFRQRWCLAASEPNGTAN